MTTVKSVLVNIHYCISHVLPQALNTETIWNRSNIKEVFKWGKYCEEARGEIDEHLRELAPLTHQPGKYCYEYVSCMCDHLLHALLQNGAVMDDLCDVVKDEYVSQCGSERYDTCVERFHNVKGCYKVLMEQCTNNHKWDFFITSLSVSSQSLSENEIKEKIILAMKEPILFSKLIHHLVTSHEFEHLQKHFALAVSDLHPFSTSFWPFWTTLAPLDLTDMTTLCKSNNAIHSAFTGALLQLGKCLLVVDDEVLRTDGKPMPPGLLGFVEKLLTECELSAKLMKAVCNDTEAEGFWNYVIVKADTKHVK